MLKHKYNAEKWCCCVERVEQVGLVSLPHRFAFGFLLLLLFCTTRGRWLSSFLSTSLCVTRKSNDHIHTCLLARSCTKKIDSHTLVKCLFAALSLSVSIYQSVSSVTVCV